MIMNPIVITRDLAARGIKVTRGPGWEWDNQDGGPGTVGSIIEDPTDDGWVAVQWPDGCAYSYRVGAEGRYDLAMYSPFTSTAMKMTRNSPTPRVQEVRQALSESVKRAESSVIRRYEKQDLETQKSNSNYGNSNTSTDSGKPEPLKVRRPISTIQGSKRRSRAPIKRRRGSARS